MEFAASCHPLENSKAKVRKTVIRSRLKVFTGAHLEVSASLRAVLSLTNRGA
jgi:hypothetical protein